MCQAWQVHPLSFLSPDAEASLGSLQGYLIGDAESLKTAHSKFCVFPSNGSLQTVWSIAVISWLLRQEIQYRHWSAHRFGSRRKVIVLFCLYKLTVLQPVLNFVVFEKCHHLQQPDKSPDEHYKMCWVRTLMASRGLWPSTLIPTPPGGGWPSPQWAWKPQNTVVPWFYQVCICGFNQPRIESTSKSLWTEHVQSLFCIIP